jgi:hypothetical protein
MEPESLLRDFIDITGLKIRRLRTDNEFTASTSFTAFCKRRGIVLCPSVAYTHTMQARAEGAVRICKEHVRCALKASNAPTRFWPFALIHFCRTFNYWPGATTPPPWETMMTSLFSFNLERDLHPWGCYMVAKIPRENPMVEDTTHSDRGVEGAFLGWHDTTPTCWMFSFKHQRILRVQDAVFNHDEEYPFRTPESIITPGVLTADLVAAMHSEDALKGEPTEDDTLSQAQTQTSPPTLSPLGGASPVEQHEAHQMPVDGSMHGDGGALSPDMEASLAPLRDIAAKLKDIQRVHPVAGLGEGAKPTERPSAAELKRSYKLWTNGRQVPLNAEIEMLSDKQLGQCLAHHSFVFKLPSDWFDETWNVKKDGYVMARKCYGQKGTHYLDCDVIEPVEYRGRSLQFSISEPKLTRRQIERGLKNDYVWWLRKLLDTSYGEPRTLEDIGLSQTAVERVHQQVLNIWCGAPATADPTPKLHTKQTEDELQLAGPFSDVKRNEIWQVLASQMAEGYEHLADLDMLEPNPPNRTHAMRNERLRPFWVQSEEKEMQGLWKRGCFKKWNRRDLDPTDRVFGSRFHYNIKRDGRTGRVTNCKVRLVVMGNRMKEGEDYDDSFAPVPHATVARNIISIAAALDLELHSCDMAQAFIQADKLDEGINGRVFIRAPLGYPEDPNVVYEVLRPLYGIPSSARALHLTLSAWFKSEGFTTAGFEDSVWVRSGGGKYEHDIIVSAHIDDTLMATESLVTMQKFKEAFLTRFEGTDEGEVTTYLGCELVRDRATRTIIFRQSVYAQKVLQIYGCWDNVTPVSTPLQPGVRLSMADAPDVVDPELHRRYRGITGHISFLVTMTRCDLAFAYSELSKFLHCPGPVHLQAAERVLHYLRGTYEDGLVYSDPGPKRRNVLAGWVDSDYASDPDNRKSVTGYVLSMNNAPVSWKAKRQDCVTLSSAEAEYVAASMCGQEVVYLRAMLRGFGYEQTIPTEVWEDNAACIQMANNPVNRKFTRHIDTRRYYVRDLVRDKVMDLVKCAGVKNVADALTKSLPSPSWSLHRPYMVGTRREYEAFYLTLGLRAP